LTDTGWAPRKESNDDTGKEDRGNAPAVSPCTQKYVREEAIVSQVDRAISKIALGGSIADAILAELESDGREATKRQEAAVAETRADLALCEKRIDLLLDMRLSEQVAEAEHVSKKHILVNRKAELRGKLESFEHNRLNRFEPVTRFVLEAKHASILLAEGNPAKNRDFLQKNRFELPGGGKIVGILFQKPLAVRRRIQFRPR
jgi:hypothetical protein